MERRGRVLIAPAELLDPGVECCAVWDPPREHRDRSSSKAGAPKAIAERSQVARSGKVGPEFHYFQVRGRAGANPRLEAWPDGPSRRL